MAVRYAVYFAPNPQHCLGMESTSVVLHEVMTPLFGRDGLTGEAVPLCVPQGFTEKEWRSLVKTPAHYGLHATLKAPFELARAGVRATLMRSVAETAWLEDCLVILSQALVAAKMPVPSYSMVRAPEAGLIMARGRIGNTGDAFNVGEVMVTRCVVALNVEDERGTPNQAQVQSFLGYAWVMGEQARHAEIAALLDALWLREAYASLMEIHVAPMLMQRRMDKEASEANAVAKTKVDFFTMVRGED
ncbi:MAG: phosphonate C-P lyase system protein PhnG [Pseudomonadota bacterium]